MELDFILNKKMKDADEVDDLSMNVLRVAFILHTNNHMASYSVGKK